MRKSNLQVRVPEEVSDQIEAISGKSKSSFVREAILEKIQRELHRRQEEQWIAALKKHPEDLSDAQVWMKAEGWGSK